MKYEITNYTQLQNAIDSAIASLPEDAHAKQWGLKDLFTISLRGTSNQISYIFANYMQLIKYCKVKGRTYDDLRNHINKRLDIQKKRSVQNGTNKRFIKN